MKIKPHMLNVFLLSVLDLIASRLYSMVDVQDVSYQLVVQLILGGIQYFNRILSRVKQEARHSLKWLRQKKIVLVIEADRLN